MDDLDLYKDLDEFYQHEDKKSKELLAWEQKYVEAIKTNEELLEDNKQLKKNMKMIEVNFQSLLDTARAELRRKQREIDSLREKYDDICFRRIVPKIVHCERKYQQQQERLEQPPEQNAKQMNVTDKSLCKTVKERQPHNHSSRESSKILTNVELRKSLYSSTAISDNNKIRERKSESSKEGTLGRSNRSHNNYSEDKYHIESKRRVDSNCLSHPHSPSRSRSRSQSRSRSRSRFYAEKRKNHKSNKRNRSRSDSNGTSAKNSRAHKHKRQSPERNTSYNAKGRDNFNNHKQTDRNEKCKIQFFTTEKSAKRKKSQDGIIPAKPKSPNNTCKQLSPTIKSFTQQQQKNCTESINYTKREKKLLETEYKIEQRADTEETFKKEILDGAFVSTLNKHYSTTENVAAEHAVTLMLPDSQTKGKVIEKGIDNDNDNAETNTKVRNQLNENMYGDADMDRRDWKTVENIQKNANSIDEDVTALKIMQNYATSNPINKIKVGLLKNFKGDTIGKSHDRNGNINLEPYLGKTTDKVEHNALATSNSAAKITEALTQLTENNIDNMQKKHLNKNNCEELEPLKVYKDIEKSDPACVVVYVDAISQNISNNNVNQNNHITLPKDNVNMNVQQEEKIRQAVHSANKLQPKDVQQQKNIQREKKSFDEVHPANKLPSTNKDNINVQQKEKIKKAIHPAKKGESRDIISMNIHEEEKSIEAVHSTNKLQPKDNINMDVHEEKKISEAAHPINKLQPKDKVNVDFHEERKIMEAAHPIKKLQVRVNVNVDVQQKEKMIDQLHPAKKLQPKVNVNTDIQEEEKIIEVLHQTNKLQQSQFNGRGNESGSGQENDSEEIRTRLDGYNVKHKPSKKDVNVDKHCNDDVVTYTPIIKHPRHSGAMEIENMDGLSLLPSIKNIPTIPTNFSGIFTKNLLEMSSSSSSSCDNNATKTTTTAKSPTSTALISRYTSRKKEKSSDLLKTNLEILCRREYILPAVSVLCNVDNLENVTKVTDILNKNNNKKKTKMTKKIKKYEKMIPIEDDKDKAGKNNENKNNNTALKVSHYMKLDTGRFACLENLSNFNSNSNSDENGEEGKSKKPTEKASKKIEENLCEEFFAKIEKSNKSITEKKLKGQGTDEIAVVIKGGKSLFSENETMEYNAHKNNMKSIDKNENKLKNSKTIKTVQVKMKRFDMTKYSVKTKSGDEYKKDVAVKSLNEPEPIKINSNEIVQNESVECLQTPTQSAFEERMPQSVVQINTIEVITEDECKTQFHSENFERTEIVDMVNSHDIRIKDDEVKVDKEPANHLISNALSGNNEKYDLKKNHMKEEEDVSTSLLQKLLLSDEDSINNNNRHDNVINYNLNTPPKTSSDLLQDEVFKQIDTEMCELFQSPHCATFQKQQEQELKERHSDDCVNDKLRKSVESSIVECINSNQENIQSTLNAASSTLIINNTIDGNLSTLPSSSLSNPNVKEIKYMSMGSSEYRFEKVSKNVVNLYISRKRNRKTLKTAAPFTTNS